VVNDSCGHAAGDELLRQITSALQRVVRQRDTLARMGGDEFSVLMERCSLEQAQRLADDLYKVIQNYVFLWEGQSFRVGVSIGLVAITEATPNLTELLKEADTACYMAKDSGRNRIHVYHPQAAETAQRHGEMQWVSRLNKALEKNRFCLYAQAIVPLGNSSDRHYELLIRMIGDNQEIIPPGAFLPAAERYNLITKIDLWVIGRAFILLAENPVFVNDVSFISINLSGQYFGSGLSSFGYLKSLPVDYLKIDGMFVKDIIDDPIDHAMVKSINEIGQIMGMKTIAEFVESDEIKGMLREIGVDYAQGYGIAKPLPFQDILQAYK
jgi:diguanylate cyclase (GGDEF)-like protein